MGSFSIWHWIIVLGIFVMIPLAAVALIVWAVRRGRRPQ